MTHDKIFNNPYDTLGISYEGAIAGADCIDANFENDYIRQNYQASEDAAQNHVDQAQIDVFAAIGFYTVPDLTEEERRPPEFFVAEMIPVGLSFLAGSPKTRKSFFALQMATAIATGTSFLGRPTIQSDVIYFDLEGSKSRIATRAEMLPQSVPRNVFITNRALHKLSDGLVDDIRALHQQDPKRRVFIIDTYSRARGQFNSKGANAYDLDVSILEPLQRMAIEENIAVVCVHHFKKGADAALSVDSFEAMSGTMAIGGSSDSVLNLVKIGKRFEGRAILEITPRDAKSCEIDIFFDDMTGRWRDISNEAQDPRSNPICKWIIDNMPKKGAAPDFVAYTTIASETLTGYTESPGNTIRDACLTYRKALLDNYGCAIQVGARNNSSRGIRIMRL